MSRKIYKILSLLFVFAFVLAACAPATAVPEAPAAPTEAPAEPTSAPVEDTIAQTEEPAAPEAAPVTITWWHIQVADDQKALWQDMADQYMADHPNVTIEITVLENENFKTKLTTVMQSGNPPDIFQSWGGGTMNEYAQAGLLKEIGRAHV
jgi:raffinose/stachyose/melibiose transport system substrate-binding protein